MEAGLIPESTWHIRARTHTLSPHPPTHNIQLCQATNLAAGSSSRLILAHTHTHTHTLSHTHIRTHTHTCSALMTEFNPFPLLAHTRTHTHTLTTHARTHTGTHLQRFDDRIQSIPPLGTHTHAHTHSHTRTHAHTLTHTCSALMTEFNPFPLLAHTRTHTHSHTHTHARTHAHTCSALMTEFNPFPLLALEPTIHRRQLPKGCGFKHLRSFCHVIALLRTHTHAGAKCVAVLEKGYGVCVSLCLCVQVCVCARVLKITLC